MPTYYPIIYVRGYSGTQSDVEETVDDPTYGFNSMALAWTRNFTSANDLINRIPKESWRSKQPKGGRWSRVL